MHDPIREDVVADFEHVVAQGAFTNGPQVREFEVAFAAYCGTADCVGVANGLDALRLGLVAAGLTPGDEVIVPAETFAATFEAVTQAGGTPVIVDSREDDYGIDVDAVEAAAGPRTRFVMPVHLYGQMVDMQALAALAANRELSILSDACQAHGARRDGVGAAGNAAAAAFSFYPGKNLGAFGDGGALTTDDPELATRMRALREHGQTAKYHHECEGWTSRLDTLQAVALLHKLPHLDDWNAQRRQIARRYDDALEEVGDLRLPQTVSGSDHVWHLYVIRTEDPEALGSFLRERGIGTGRHYPKPPHLSPAYARLGYRPGSFPVAEAISRECLSLPMFPGMTEGEVDRVATAISEFFDG
jgi:dTDP-4-amino-4,6-dideoxygalactose transaminase